jgi:hypothetical protein
MTTCVPDGRGRYLKMIAPGCTPSAPASVVRLDWSCLIWQCKANCDYRFNVHSQTYIVGSDGDCQPVTVPAKFAQLTSIFPTGSTMQRAKVSYSPVLGGQYKLQWFSESSLTCENSALQFSLGTKKDTCTKFAVSTGYIHLSEGRPYTTRLVGTPTPSPTAAATWQQPANLKASGGDRSAAAAGAAVAVAVLTSFLLAAAAR